MPNQAYRLRIRSADDLSDTLVLTSIRGGTNPYIAAPPSGDGQEIDLLTGAVRTGAYVVEVVDAVTGSDAIGTIRVVTNKLYDGIEEYLLLENGDKILLESGDPIELEQNNAEFGRPHLLSRKAYVEMSSDGGSTWSVWIAGYLTSVRQTDAIRYAFTVSNSRRVEQTKQVFTWQTAAERTAFPKRGCIFGGPVIEGLGGGTTRTVDSGGWEFLYRATTGSSASPIEGDTLALKYDFGYFPPFYERKAVPGPDQTAQFWNNLLPFMQPVPIDSAASGADFAALRGDYGPLYGASDILCIVTNPATGDEWLGSLRGIDIDGQAADNNNRRTFVYKRNIFVTLYRSETSWPALPAQGTTLRVRGVTRQVSEASPLYLQAHPVDIAAALYTQANLSVNSASVTSVKALVGSTMWLTARITQAQTMADFLETALYGPFGFSARTNASGEMEFFSTRALTSNAPTETINNASIVGDTPPTIFDLDESTVVTGFTITQVALNVATATDTPFTQRPADNVFSTTQPIEYVSGDTTTYSTRVVNYDIPGMVTDSESFVPTFQELARGIALEGFDRFGRGAPSGEVHVLRTASVASANIGDFVYVDASYYPNKNYRVGESSVGPRVAQIVRREERPEGPLFKFVDAGPFVQPALAPTITIAASSTDARRVAAFTITNAAAIANAADISVAVEYGTGSTQPSGGITFTRYTAAQLPTGAVDLPAVKPGSRVWVRARTEQAGIFPSAWSAWADVTLTAWAAPTGVTVGTLTNQTAAVSWNLNGNTSDPVDVYVAPGSVAPSSWTKYRVNTLPPNTTATTITGLLGSTAYIVGVAFRDMVANVAQTPVTATFTSAAGTTGTCEVPAGLAVLEGINDVSLAQGVVLALWPSVGASSFVLERAPNLTSGATDYPGTYVELAVLPSTAETYVDYLPRTGAKYWYRVKHRADGQADSAYVPQRTYIAVGSAVYAGVMGVATGVPADILRPPGTAIILTPESLYDDAGPSLKQLLIRLQYTDPQNRVVYYEYRTRQRIKQTWGAWSAWTGAIYPRTDLTYMQAEVTLASTSYIYQTEWRVYAADAEGNVSFFRTGTTEWPQNYGTNKATVKVQKQGYNISTGKYEVWWRYYFDRGNNTFDEDGEDNTQQAFTTQVVAASVIDQFGTTASGVVTSGTKTASGWYASWTSTPSQAWTFEVSVDTAMPTQYYLQYQDADYLDEQFVSTTTAVTTSAVAASPTGEYPSTLFNIPNNGSNVSTALASAISTIDSLGGGTLLLQAGTYDLSADLEVPRSVSLRGDAQNETVITTTDGTTRYLKVTGSGTWLPMISNLTFVHVGIVYGNTITDYGNGAVLKNCQISNVEGAAVTYRFNSWLTAIEGCRLFDNQVGVLCDFSTNGTGTVSISGTTATFSTSQSGLIGQRVLASGQIFQVTAGSGTSWTVTPSASPAVSGAAFKYGVIVGSGAAMKIVHSDIYCDDAWNATRTTYCIQMLGGTTDGYQLFVDNCDLEHVNGAVVYTLQNWSDGGIFLNNVNMELIGNLSSPNTAGYFVNNDGAKVFLDGFVALSVTEKAWFKQSAGLIYVQKGRGSFLANRLAEITGGVIITDQGSWFGEGRPFTYPSNALALSPNSLSTGGMFVTTRNWLSLAHDKTVTTLTPGSPTQQPITIQPFDGNDRIIAFDFECDTAGATDNILRIDMANGVTGPPRIDVVLPNVNGIGHLTILHKPRRPTDWDNATLVNGAMTISGYFVETATNLTTAISATVADDGPPYTTKFLTFTTIAVTGGSPVPATIDIYALTEQAAGPKLTGM